MVTGANRKEAGEPASRRRARERLRRAVAGGPAGNEELTASIGVLLIALLAALGVTILRIGPLLNAHMFLGMLLIGPVAAKLASTAYRFARYYTNNPPYRRKGPPSIELRLLAPLVVLTTIVVFATGAALLYTGPGARDTLLTLHKVSFVAWIGVTALHVLGHLAGLPAALRGARRLERPWDDQGSGCGARALLIAGALAGGLVIALLTESRFAAVAHGHHHGG